MKKQWRQEENGGNRKEKDAKSGGRIMIYRELGKTGLIMGVLAGASGNYVGIFVAYVVRALTGAA